jgi:hypothetical protein
LLVVIRIVLWYRAPSNRPGGSGLWHLIPNELASIQSLLDVNSDVYFIFNKTTFVCLQNKKYYENIKKCFFSSKSLQKFIKDYLNLFIYGYLRTWEDPLTAN